MDFFVRCVEELLNFDWDFVFSDKFLCYGFLIFWFVVPIIVFLFCEIFIFFLDYSEFRLWKSEQAKNLIDESKKG